MADFAFDSLQLESQRHIDSNGFLHVAESNVTKEQVAPYKGEEIPGYEALGFEKDGIYHGYRSAEELRQEETVKSLDGIPILLNHHVDLASCPQKEYRIGSTGTDAAFKAPYLTNSLHFTDEDAIKRINDGSMKELSLCYKYKPVKQAGTFEGQHYDFIMTHIRCNHLALVENGRAGDDVYVADSSEGLKSMSTETQNSGDGAAKVIANALTQAAQAITEGQQPKAPKDEPKPTENTTNHDDSHKEGKNMDETENASGGGRDELIKAFLEKVAGAGLDPDKVKEEIDAILAAKDEQPDDTPAAPDTPAPEEGAGEGAGGEGEGAGEGEAPLLDDAAKDAMKSCGLDAENPDLQKAFALGMKSGGEGAAKDEGDEDEGTDADNDETLAADSAEKIAKMVEAKVQAKMQAKFAAADECKSSLGAVKAMAYDSADTIYRDALKAEGMDIKGLKAGEYRTAYRSYMAAKAKASGAGYAKDSALGSTGKEPSAISAILGNVGG